MNVGRWEFSIKELRFSVVRCEHLDDRILCLYLFEI